MAVEVGFYHCTRDPAPVVAVRLAAKVHASGQRLLLVADGERLVAIDQHLWTFDDASFLPHGVAGSGHDDEQPVLLAPSVPDHAANGARLLMLVETGLPAGFEGYDRLLNLFGDGTPAHQRARADWKAIGGRDGVERVYWQQTERGAWERA